MGQFSSDSSLDDFYDASKPKHSVDVETLILDARAQVKDLNLYFSIFFSIKRSSNPLFFLFSFFFFLFFFFLGHRSISEPKEEVFNLLFVPIGTLFEKGRKKNAHCHGSFS